MLGVAASAFTDHLTAWATLGAAVGTVATLLFLAWQWTTDLTSQRRSEVRAQAVCVSAWLGSPPPQPGSEFLGRTEFEFELSDQKIGLLNDSKQPVYEVIACLALIQIDSQAKEPTPNLDYKATLSVLPPGRYLTTVPLPPTSTFRRYGVELAFKDGTGVCWLRRAEGELERLRVSPREHYGLKIPVDWRTPEEQLVPVVSGAVGAD